MALNLDKCIEQLMRGEILGENTVKEICGKLKEQLIDEPNVAIVRAPVTVVGDVQGQFHDLLEIFRIGGKCPDTNYLFLGSFVNRGNFSLETASLLVCLKLRYPSRITILRGNHETKALTEVYGFYSECMRKYGNASVWKSFTDLFNYLNIAAVIEDRIFAVHGGLSAKIQSIDQIRVLDRMKEVPPEGPLTDLLWSDPDPEREGYNYSLRNAGCSFGHNAVKQFLQVNKFDHILRGHQLCMDGYQVLFDNKLSTIWSAPNYGYRCGNVAAVLEINEAFEKYFNTFCACPESEREHPEVDMQKELPDYFA